MKRERYDSPCSQTFRAYFNDEPVGQRHPRTALDLNDEQFARHIRRGGGLVIRDPITERIRALEAEVQWFRAELRRVQQSLSDRAAEDAIRVAPAEFGGIKEISLHACSTSG